MELAYTFLPSLKRTRESQNKRIRRTKSSCICYVLNKGILPVAGKKRRGGNLEDGNKGGKKRKPRSSLSF